MNSYNSVKISGDAGSLAETVNFYKNDMNVLGLAGSNSDEGTVNIVGSMNPNADGTINLISSQSESKGTVNIFGKLINVEGELNLNGMPVNTLKRYVYTFTITLTANNEQVITFPVDPTIVKKTEVINVTAASAGTLTFNGEDYSFQTGSSSITIPITTVDKFTMQSDVACTCSLPIYI